MRTRCARLVVRGAGAVAVVLLLQRLVGSVRGEGRRNSERIDTWIWIFRENER